MNKFWLIILLFLLTGLNSGFSEELIVRVPDNNEYPPFFLIDRKGKRSGLSIELAEVLLKGAGYKPKYQSLPFARGLWYLESGEVHLMLNLSIKKERAEYINFIGPQLDETVVLVVPKGSNFKIKTLDDFKRLEKPIGIERKMYYGKAFEEKFKNDNLFKGNIELVTDIVANEKKLVFERLSGFLGYGYNIYYRFKTSPIYKKFKVHKMTIHQDWVFFGFSKKTVSKEMLKKLQKSYDKASKNGSFERIKKRYRLYQ
ncbi:MAG: amino acid ABC transporter substrate-binding protein [Desulfobacterales bacterium]|nr:amino acid ABC transporter substrate-binding protein [Desulfobacterales bacterium]MCP4161473.1 amino acid ABC transporter substrate-binding protein [Deltaproteobacteria bacterium]